MYNIETKAMELLQTNHVTSFPIDPRKLHLPGKTIVYSTYGKSAAFLEEKKLLDYSRHHQGFTYVTAAGNYCILLSDSLGYGEQLSVLAHEIGHIDCMHLSHGGILGKAGDKAVETRQEQEADYYANVLIAPWTVLEEMGVQTVPEIQAITKCDVATAQAALIKINEKRQLKAPKQSLVELAVCVQFQACIRSYQRGLQLHPLQTASPSFRHRLHLLHAAFGAALLLVILLPLFFPSANRPFSPAPVQSPAPSSQSFQSSSAQRNAISSDQIVYVTKSGEKYHLPHCSAVEGRDNLRTHSISQARQLGYAPCQLCHPDKQQ